VARGLENLALLPVGEPPRVQRFAALLTAALETHDSVLHVDASALEGREESALAEWLHDHLHEYATLRAIGYPNRFIAGIVAQQAAIDRLSRSRADGHRSPRAGGPARLARSLPALRARSLPALRLAAPGGRR
jgi:hypothetical protein